jgi:hypothetical protein
VTFEVRGPDEGAADVPDDAFDAEADDAETDDAEAWETSDAGEAPSGLAIVETRTAGRVAPVIRAG